MMTWNAQGSVFQQLLKIHHALKIFTRKHFVNHLLTSVKQRILWPWNASAPAFVSQKTHNGSDMPPGFVDGKLICLPLIYNSYFNAIVPIVSDVFSITFYLN